jgi:signal transduction histidine kinase
MKQNRQSPPAITEYDLLQTQIEMEEQTFQKISTEIHDNISLTLSLSKLYLHDIDLNDHQEVNDKINLSISLLRKGIEDLNNLSKSLSAVSIEKFGLLRSVEELVNDVKSTELFSLNFIVTGCPVPMSNREELIIFRMIQESFNNIIKHAGATSVDMLLDYSDNKTHITIRDNGVGFNSLSVYDGSGTGNMKKRARMIDAVLSIESLQGRGTTIRITVPVKNKMNIIECSQKTR